MSILPFGTQVKIGSYVYRIDVVKDKFPCADGTGLSLGQIDHHRQTITLVDAPPRALVGTLWHEVTHGIDYVQGTGLTELQVTGFANGLYSVLLDNEWIKIKE